MSSMATPETLGSSNGEDGAREGLNGAFQDRSSPTTDSSLPAPRIDRPKYCSFSVIPSLPRELGRLGCPTQHLSSSRAVAGHTNRGTDAGLCPLVYLDPVAVALGDV